MSYISDKDSAPLSLFGVNGGNTSNDASLSTLVGAKFNGSDGREFVLVQNGASALVSGVLVQSPANLADFVSLVCPTASAIGSTTVNATLGGVAVVSNEFAGGFVVISTATGIGQTLKIASHPAQSSTTGNVAITTEDPLSVALDTTSTISLFLPEYGSQSGTVAAGAGVVSALGVIVCPTSSTGRVLGATLYPIPASTSTVPSYGFIQTKGVVGIITENATAIGLDVMPSGETAGRVVTYIAATNTRVGTTVIAAVDDAATLINLQL